MSLKQFSHFLSARLGTPIEAHEVGVGHFEAVHAGIRYRYRSADRALSAQFTNRRKTDWIPCGNF